MKSDIEIIEEALKALSFAAQTSGGTQGVDMTLVNAIDSAEIALAAVQRIKDGDGDYFAHIVAQSIVSAEKAINKFPQPNYVALKIAEEAGEVVRGCVHYAEGRMPWEEVEGEIVQLMAMLYRLINEGDEVNGVIPPHLLKTTGGSDGK